MNHARLTGLFLLAFLAAGALTALIGAAPTVDDQIPHSAVEPCSAETNLLVNPSFEGPYASYVPPVDNPDCPLGVCTTAQMADGWTPWWRSSSGDPDDTDVNPEYKPAEAEFFPNRVRSGERAQQYFTFYRTHEAGIYQQVSGLTPGETVCFSVWGHAWSAQDDDPISGPEDGWLDQKVGIDPTGGTAWDSDTIVWSDPRRQYDEFGVFGVETVAQADTITVFTHSAPLWPVKHNDVYWDDAVLVSLAPAQPELQVTPDQFFLWAEAGTTETLSAETTITITQGVTNSWTATLAPGNTITPTLSTAGGAPGDTLTATLDPTGLAAGVYTATVRIDAGDTLAGSPTAIVIQITLVDELAQSYLPALSRP